MPAGFEERRGARAQVFVEDLARPAPGPADVHHLTRVLRLRPGEVVVAADGRGAWRLCEMAGARDGGAALRPVGPAVLEARPEPELTVAFAPVKGDRPEWTVEKLTELGVDHLVVLMTDRSVVRWAPDRAARALVRLQAVARQAAAQSRRVWLPTLLGPCTLPEAAGAVGAETLWVAEPGGAPPDPALRALAVGPEGGWSERELAIGFPTVALSDGVLRAETAAVAAAVTACALRAGTVGPAMPRHTNPRTARPDPGVQGPVR